MEIRIVEEAGHLTAIEAMAFSHQTECDLQLIPSGDVNLKTAKTLASKDKGHNKFLESIMVWFDMRAPLYFWKQFDTYRVGITKQSKSTMHTLMKQLLWADDLVDTVSLEQIDYVNEAIKNGNFNEAIANLPEGYLQTRRVCCSYKTIRHIIQQRQHHKLGEWKEFCDFMKDMLEYPELLGGDIL